MTTEHQCPITWVEVFAERRLEGNLLPVLHDTDGVPGDVLARAARRFLQSETSAIQSATEPGASYRHRIFTIAEEIAFAGHPSLGAAAAFAHRAAMSSGTLVQQTLSGNHSLDVQLNNGFGRATLHQPPAVFFDPIDPSPVLAALGIDPASALHDLAAQIVSTGLPALILPVDLASLQRARFDRVALTAALAWHDHPLSLNCYVVAPAVDGTWRARSFALDMTSGEDPATGSAAGPFGAYLNRYRDISSVVVDQGIEMGSPSRLYVDTTDGIAVAGAVRIVGTGTHLLPGH